MTGALPTLAEAKARARALRAALAAQGTDVSHSQALELIAQRHGYRDWNTFRARLDTAPARALHPGDRVTGQYLSQPFAATIRAVETLHPGWVRVTLDLDEAVDVVTFDSFSNFRKRITGVIGPEGRSREATSDGKSHLILDR